MEFTNLRWVYHSYKSVVQEQPDNLHIPIKLPNSIHALSAPLTLVRASIFPLVQTVSLSSVLQKGSGIGVTICPTINSFAVFLSLIELAVIRLAIGHNKLTVAMLHVTSPLTLINIAVFIDVSSRPPLIVTELAIENISIEKHQSSSDFLLFTPLTLENCSLGKSVQTFAVLGSVCKVAFIKILICVFKPSKTMWKVIPIRTNMMASICIQSLALTLLSILNEVSDVNVVLDIGQPAPTMFGSGMPLSFVFLLSDWIFEETFAFLDVLAPVPRIVGTRIIVVGASATLQTHI